MGMQVQIHRRLAHLPCSPTTALSPAWRHGRDERGVHLTKFHVHEHARGPARGRTRAPASAAVQNPPYFLATGRHPHPQVFAAGGFVALAFLLTACLRIFFTSFWSGFPPRGSPDQGGHREDWTLPGWFIKA